MTDSPSVPPDDSGRPQSLGALLRTSRERKGLELDDVAEVTHVRKEYLRALEDGRYADLPEDVYARNFLRLYAQAVGLESGKLLDMFARERVPGRSPRSAGAGEGGVATPAPPPARPFAKASPAGRAAPRAPVADERSAGSVPVETAATSRPAFEGLGDGRGIGLPAIRLGSLLATLLLVAAIVALALWAFNNQLFGGGGGDAQPPSIRDGGGGIPVPPADGATPPATEGTPEATEQALDVLVTVQSTPPGAEVTVDGFPLPGTTPVQDVPVTARASRLVRVTLDGYEPFEATYDLSFDRTLDVTLEPAAPEAPAQAASPDTEPNGPPTTAGQGEIALNVTEPTWLEVYAGTARGQGSRLVYTTAQPGNTYLFDLPVYVHVGNAAGLHVSVNGQDLGSFGSPGAVMGRAFNP